ncbi:putative phage tail protein [Clostridium estertheticum]|uniref:putative phage tail protein n=1 Tax=Clostridium estertheticum TaxID=238834 RepID=UPI001CC9BCF4|nr:putative phage tail protein [Clostridium estertheticum]MBZ9615284.1 YmfQ family protein [Clostridium estertheticum subsp. laramiense]WAG75173.1 YmfQ family protein [Clostridium estertheticum]
MYSDNLKRSVAASVGNKNIFSSIYNAQGIELDTLFSNIDDINAQFNVDTATWALDIYEKELGITTDYTRPFDYRRSVIKSKNRGNGKLDATMIKLVCDSFINGDVQITFDGIIHVKFTSIKGIPPNLNDLKNAVEQIKPAYLLLDYLYSYLLIKEIDNVMTLDQLQNTELNLFAGGA